ncbi:MAG: glycosyltransferase family 2 protein [Halothiobacillaceae bacterium]
MVEVSIITPAYNSSVFISNAIESVIKQTFTNWEMIIVDDCSDDKTVAIVEDYIKRDPRIHLIKLEKNSGAAVARNAAIRAAKGRYISFLDSDDQWLPHKLESQLSFIRKHDAFFVFSAYRRVDEDGHSLGVIGVPETVTYSQLLKTCYIGCLTAMYDSQKLGKVEMPLIHNSEDLGLWLKLLKKIPVAYGQQEVLATYMIRDGSVSSNKISAAAHQWKIYRDIEGIGRVASSYYFINYAVRGVLRSRFSAVARALGVMHKVKNGDE